MKNKIPATFLFINLFLASGSLFGAAQADPKGEEAAQADSDQEKDADRAGQVKRKQEKGPGTGEEYLRRTRRKLSRQEITNQNTVGHPDFIPPRFLVTAWPQPQ